MQFKLSNNSSALDLKRNLKRLQ